MIGTLLKDRFLIEAELGRGGMGIVYKAEDKTLGRKVAIKALKHVEGSDLTKKILLEAQITARLVHQHIVTLFDIIANPNESSYLVMEMVTGSSFHNRIKKLPLDQKLRVVMETALALDYAHCRGVIHRDVKPANILMMANDQAKLSDFGLSLREEDAKETSTIKGTPLYMSPEQATGKKITHRADSYALGVILYECVCGSPPFSGPAMFVMTQHSAAEPEPIRNRVPNVPKPLEKLIHSLLLKEPEKRPATCKAVAEALQQIIAPTPIIVNASASTSIATPADASGSAETIQKPDTITASIVDSSKASYAVSINTPPTQTIATTPSSKSMEGGSDKTKASQTSVKDAKIYWDSRHPLIQQMLGPIDAIPLIMSPRQRFLTGHYLAYLLGGSRKQGVLGKRPLDNRNADRARLIVAMIHLMMCNGSDESFQRATQLLDLRPDPRAALSPSIVIKYLNCRKTPTARTRFRDFRDKLRDLSKYAVENMVDENNLLNPGLMPQSLRDLQLVAPFEEAIDDQIVERWNRLTQVWKENAKFRNSVLRYGTRRAYSDPASIELWPEVVFPLLERARWQRQNRGGLETLKETAGRVFLIPQAGVAFDKAVRKEVPIEILDEIDDDLDAFQDEFEVENADISVESDNVTPIDEDEWDNEPRGSDRLTGIRGQVIASLAEERDVPQGFMPLASQIPTRFTMGEIHRIYTETVRSDPRQSIGAGVSMAAHNGKAIHQAIGNSYRIMTTPSYRGRSAGQVAIVGTKKQIEMLVPSIKLSSDSSSRPIIAAWLYTDGSLALTYVDYKNTQLYAYYKHTSGELERFDDLEQMRHALLVAKMEQPDQLREVLTKKYREPAN